VANAEKKSVFLMLECAVGDASGIFEEKSNKGIFSKIKSSNRNLSF